MPSKAPSKADRGGIVAISVCGYKSIRDKHRIELRPLTLLAGANSSGKSSIMQPLLLLKQTLEAPYDPGPLRLDGPNVRFTSVDQLLSKVRGRACSSEFSVGLETAGGSSIELTFSRSAERGFDIRSMAYSNGQKEAGTLFPGMTEEQISLLPLPALRHFYETLVRRRQDDMRWDVVRERCFLRLVLRRAEPGDLVPVLPSRYLAQLDRAIMGVIHLPGLRGNPARAYGTTAVGEYFLGEFHNYLASIVTQWQARDQKLLDSLAGALENLGLTWRIKARPVDDTQVELEVGRLPHKQRGGAGDLVNIADVGFGVSQVLPVLVALLVARPGQVVYLEQPELHLHPRAQKGLALALAEAARRGVTVVAETHSALLLLGVQTLVAQGALPPDLVKLHWFHRRPKDGVTEVQSADLDDRGRFGEKWPEDFDDVLLQAEREYLDAVEAPR